MSGPIRSQGRIKTFWPTGTTYLTGTRPAWLHGGPDLVGRLSDEMNSANKTNKVSKATTPVLQRPNLSKYSRRPSILLAPFSLVRHGGPIRTYTSVTTAITRRFPFLRFPPTTTSSLACSGLTSNFLLLVCRSYFPFSWFSAIFYLFFSYPKSLGLIIGLLPLIVYQSA